MSPENPDTHDYVKHFKQLQVHFLRYTNLSYPVPCSTCNHSVRGSYQLVCIILQQMKQMFECRPPFLGKQQNWSRFTFGLHYLLHYLIVSLLQCGSLWIFFFPLKYDQNTPFLKLMLLVIQMQQGMTFLLSFHGGSASQFFGFSYRSSRFSVLYRIFSRIFIQHTIFHENKTLSCSKLFSLALAFKLLRQACSQYDLLCDIGGCWDLGISRSFCETNLKSQSIHWLSL